MARSNGQGPGGPFAKGLNRAPRRWADDTPVITAIDPNSARVGTTPSVTLTGTHFRTLGDGTPPSILFGSNLASNVVVVNATTITCDVAAGTIAETVDVTITLGTQSSTFTAGFTYYAGTILSVDPKFGPIAGGTAVVIEGRNFVAGSTVTFDGVAATSVVFIDEEHYAAVTPANTRPRFVNVVITEPTAATAELKGGFKYTTLVRGQDIRRNPGIMVRDILNNTPNTCTFSIDGGSNKPEEGEEIQIIDSLDGDRVLFSGRIMNVDEEYEEQTDQLVWRCTATDFTWEFNALRPFGSYNSISASEIVVDLCTKYAPDFTLNHVQTGLLPISISLDGSKDMATALSEIAKAIGGGHWYIDYNRDVHFFHVPPPDLDAVVPTGNGPGAAPILAEDGPLPDTVSFDPAYVYARTTFLYSNGVESRLGPTSIVVAFTGTKKIDFTIDVGADPGGGITCVGRRVYIAFGTGPLIRGWQVDDNTTTHFISYPSAPDAPPVTYVGGQKITVKPPTPPPPPTPAEAPVMEAGEAVDYTFTPNGTYTFRVAAVYEDGTETIPSKYSIGLFLGPDNPVQPTNTLTGVQNKYIGKGPKFISLPLYPEINGVKPIYYKVYMHFQPFLLGAGQIPPTVGG